MDAQFASLRAARRQSFAMAPPRGGTASAVGAQVKDFDGKTTREEWQAEAYSHANEIGELGYALTVMASSLARGELVVVERDETGSIVEPDKDADGRDVITGDREKAERVLNAFRGPEGDHRALLAAGTVHDAVAGEALLVGSPVEDGDGIAWELVSVLEVVQDSDGHLTRKRSAAKQTSMSVAHGPVGEDKLDPDAYLSRYHRCDWAFSGDATSALRRNAAVCREIILWTQLIETTIKSRLAAGILLVPEEVTFPTDDDGIDDTNDTDAFMDDLVEHVSAPVSDRRSATSLAPLIVRAPAEYIAAWRLLSLQDNTLDVQKMLDARANAIHRLAAGLDMPLEVMEGMGDTNHWSAAGLDQSFVSKHIIPLGERLARFFTTAFLRRMLVAFEGVTPERAETLTLEYDGSSLVTRVDAAVSADQLHRDMLISDDARIEAHGLDPDRVRPTEEERARRIIEKLAVVPHEHNRPLLAALGLNLEALGVPAEVVEQLLSIPEPTASQSMPQAPPSDGTPADSLPVDDGPFPTGSDTPPEPGTEMAVLAERIRTASAAAVDRALERAANQICTTARRLPPDTRGRVDAPAYRTGPRKTEVLRLLGPVDWKSIQRSPEGLLRGAFDEVAAQTVVWLRAAFEDAGRDPMTADEQARHAASMLATSLDALALSAFRAPLQREDGLSVPMALVADALGAGVRR